MKLNQSSTQSAWGILVLRVIVGLVFLMHGGQKLFVYGFGGVAGSMANMGIPLPGLAAFVVTTVEFLGGAALMAGLFTRWAAALLTINMVVAVLAVHSKNGFFLPAGYEYALVLLAANLSLLLTGPGAVAVENSLVRQRR